MRARAAPGPRFIQYQISISCNSARVVTGAEYVTCWQLSLFNTFESVELVMR